MATVEITETKEYKIVKIIGMRILEDFLEDDYETIDEYDEIYFGELDIKNSIIFLKELKKQLTDSMDFIIKKYEEAEENRGGECVATFSEIARPLYN